MPSKYPTVTHWIDYMDAHSCPALEMDGFSVALFRADDGRVCVSIETADAKLPEDVDEESGVPRLRLYVNDCREDLDPDGEWVRHD